MPNIRNIIIFLGLAAVFTAVYINFIKSEPEPNLTTTSSLSNSTTSNNPSGASSGTQNVVAQNFLSLLLSTKDIKLDDSIFSEKSFQGLLDSSIMLVPDINAGRPNPFAQFGSDNSALPASTTSSTTPATVSGSSTTPIVPTTAPVVPAVIPTSTTPKAPTTPGTVTP